MKKDFNTTYESEDFHKKEMKNKICKNCGKSVLINENMKATISNIKEGTIQIGQGLKKPLLNFCSKECLKKFEPQDENMDFHESVKTSQTFKPKNHSHPEDLDSNQSTFSSSSGSDNHSEILNLISNPELKKIAKKVLNHSPQTSSKKLIHCNTADTLSSKIKEIRRKFDKYPTLTTALDAFDNIEQANKDFIKKLKEEIRKLDIIGFIDGTDKIIDKLTGKELLKQQEKIK